MRSIIFISALGFCLAPAVSQAQIQPGKLAVMLSSNFANNASGAYNSGGQSILNGGKLYAQLLPISVSASCTTDSTCYSTNDGGAILVSTASITIILTPNGVRQYGYDGVHSYTLTASSGTIYGCGTNTNSISVTTATQIIPWGVNYLCIPSGPGSGVGAVNSVNNSTPNVVIAGSGAGPYTGAVTVGLTNSVSPKSTTTYAFASTDAGTTILMTSPSATGVSLPATSTSGFGSGFAVTLQTEGLTSPLLLTAPSGTTLNGIAGTTGVKIGAYQGVFTQSDGSNYEVQYGIPQPSTQTGSTCLVDTFSWALCGGVVNPGTQYQGAYYATGAAAVSGTLAFETDSANEFVAPQGLVYPDTVVTTGTSCTVDSTCGTTTHDDAICLDLGTAAPYTVTLPATPTNGRTITFKDCVGQVGATNTLTVSGNGHNIDGASTMVLNSPYQEATVRYVSAATRWSIR